MALQKSGVRSWKNNNIKRSVVELLKARIKSEVDSAREVCGLVKKMGKKELMVNEVQSVVDRKGMVWKEILRAKDEILKAVWKFMKRKQEGLKVVHYLVKRR